MQQFDLSTDDSSDLDLNDVSSDADGVENMVVTTPVVVVVPFSSTLHHRTAGTLEERDAENEEQMESRMDSSQMILGDSSGDVSQLMGEEDGNQNNEKRGSQHDATTSGLRNSLGAQAHRLQQRLSQQTNEVLK